MDKLTTISATLFLTADVFAIVALAMPDWIVDVQGKEFSCFGFVFHERNCIIRQYYAQEFIKKMKIDKKISKFYLQLSRNFLAADFYNTTLIENFSMTTLHLGWESFDSL